MLSIQDARWILLRGSIFGTLLFSFSLSLPSPPQPCLPCPLLLLPNPNLPLPAVPAPALAVVTALLAADILCLPLLQPLDHRRAAGLDYRHGTGHGVGSFLNVHEGPIGISPRARSAIEPLKKGNVLSNGGWGCWWLLVIAPLVAPTHR